MPEAPPDPEAPPLDAPPAPVATVLPPTPEPLEPPALPPDPIVVEDVPLAPPLPTSGAVPVMFPESEPQPLTNSSENAPSHFEYLMTIDPAGGCSFAGRRSLPCHHDALLAAIELDQQFL